jgi:predicted phosphodiesterase
MLCDARKRNGCDRLFSSAGFVIVDAAHVAVVHPVGLNSSRVCDLSQRAAAFSDIHGNVEALDAVLADIEQQGITQLWCLGDVVGNWHDPIGCLDRVEARCGVVLAGNHEVAIASRDDLPPGAQYSRAALIRAGRLKGIAVRASEWSADGIRLAHGCPSPFDPVGDYLIEDVAPREVLNACADARLIVVGHTHIAGVWRERDRWLINAGSVGEPREPNPHPTWVEIQWAGEAVSHVQHHRVAFDVELYLRNMAGAGLEVGPMWSSAVDGDQAAAVDPRS